MEGYKILLLLAIICFHIIANTEAKSNKSEDINFSDLKSFVQEKENASDIKDIKLVDCACEKTFQKEYPIEWSGR